MQNYTFLIKVKAECKSILIVCVFLLFGYGSDKILSIFVTFFEDANKGVVVNCVSDSMEMTGERCSGLVVSNEGVIDRCMVSDVGCRSISCLQSVGCGIVHDFRHGWKRCDKQEWRAQQWNLHHMC